MLGRLKNKQQSHRSLSPVHEIELACEKLKKYKSPHIDPIPSEMIKGGGRLVTMWNEEELTEQWKQSITVHIYNNGNKTDCSNYQAISLLSPTYKHNRMTIPKKYKTLPNVLLSRLTLNANEIILGMISGVSDISRSAADHVFCISQILEEKC